MSENKRKTPTGNHASSLKSISRGSRIFDSFKRLFSTVKELSDETSTLEDYSMFMDNHRKLNANLEEKDKTIMTLTIAVEDMKKAKAVMWEEFTTKHKEYQGQIDILKDAVDAKQQLESQILDTRKMQRAELAVCNSVIDSKLNSLLDSLQQEQLEEFDTDTIYDLVFPFARKCHETAFECFGLLEVSPPSVPNLSDYAVKIPLSTSTRPPARLMRCALAEFVIG